MPEYVSVLQDPKSETVVTVSKGHAESAGLAVLDQPAVDRSGRPLGPRARLTPPSALKGQDLEDALEAAGLTEDAKGKKADEKRQLLADHQQAIAGRDHEENDQ